MSRKNRWLRLCLVSMFVIMGVGPGAPALAAAQDAHHTPRVSGMPEGVPLFCAQPTVTSIATGGWSNPKTWSTGKVPGPNDKVAIAAGHRVTYDQVSNDKLECIELRGELTFATATNTRMNVVTLMVLEDGVLEIGSPANPIAPTATAEIVIADHPLNPAVDPSQIGHGIIALGKVTMHGSIKTPTFIRVSREPLAGQTVLTLERPISGWRAGDHLVIPDTRQLRANEHGPNYKPQDENVQVASISESQVTLTAPLAYDHKGARNATGTLELLPHVGNISRNVIVRSENPAGTRGHTLFISHADIDIRYAAFKELGRTRMGTVNSAEFDSDGRVARRGMNQIGRYAVHFHHDFGPRRTPANQYQFTLIGNAVDGSPKWGITIHRSHYGLIQDNVVYNTRGAGIVTEDGSESFNVFDHNFSMRSEGSREVAQGNAYSGSVAPGGDGSAFWFRGPNNYVRNNVAANASESGFGLPVAALGTVRIPKFKGADTSIASESVQFDTARAAVLEFANNEAYGAIQNGLTWVWNGTISNFTVWHPSRRGLAATPAETLVVDKLTARGDSTILASADENPVGVWVANYASKNVVIANANVQGTRVGVSSPFFYSQTSDSSREGSLTVENSYFQTYIGVSVATAYADAAKGDVTPKKAIVRSSVFERLNVATLSQFPPETISMNYGMTPGDPLPRGPIVVYDYNKQPDNNFKVYYSFQAPATAAPCHDTRPGIGGWVCSVVGSR
jgi:G8 domain